MRIVHQRLCREVVNHKNTLRIVRQRTADGPPEAVQNLPEAVSVGLQCKIFRGGRSAKGPRTVRDWTEWWGRPNLTYIGCPSHSPHQTAHILQKSLSFSLKHVGETTRSRLFGVI